jgi:hypothetical protein
LECRRLFDDDGVASLQRENTWEDASLFGSSDGRAT